MISWLTNYRYSLAVFGLTVLAAVLRFWDFDTWTLTNDELSALYRCRFSSFRELIEMGVRIDGHPALAQTLLYGIVHTFDDSVYALRLPFAFLGLLSIPLTYLLGKSLFSRTAGAGAALAMATLEFPLIYADLARPYIIGQVFCLFTALMCVQFLKSTGKRQWMYWIGLVVGGTLCAYTHYIAALSAFAIGVGALINADKSSRLRLLLALPAVAALFAPHWGITWHQFSEGSITEWLSKPSWTFLFEHVWLLLNRSGLAILFIGALIALALTMPNRRKWNRWNWTVLGWWMAPAIVGFLYSVWVSPVIQHSGLYFSMPFFYLLLFAPLEERSYPIKKIWMGLTGIVLLATTVWERDYFHQRYFGTFEALAKKSLSWEQQLPGNITHATHVNNPFYLNYYLGADSIKFRPVVNKIEQADLGQFAKLVADCRTPLFNFVWSSRSVPEEVDLIIRSNYTDLKAAVELFNCGARLYGKYDSSIDPNVAARMVEVFGKDSVEIRSVHDIVEFENIWRQSGHVEPSVEYSVLLDTLLADFAGTDLQNLTAEITLDAEAPTSMEAVLVLEVKREGEQIAWWGSDFNQWPITHYSWGKVYLARHLPKLHPTDQLVCYIWNKGKQQLEVDNVIIELRKRHDHPGNGPW